MKRLLIAVFLLAVCFGVCLYGNFKIDKGAHVLSDELNDAFSLIQNENSDEYVHAQLEKCTALWNEIKPTFSIFLSHELFRTIEVVLPVLNQSYESDRDICANNILQAKATLEDIIEGQKMIVGNLL